MKIVLLANEIAAAIAIPILILSFRGFFPHLWRNIRAGDWHSARTWLFLMVLLVDVKGIIRMAWWDILNPLSLWSVGNIRTALINGPINFIAGLGGVAGLIALYLNIPDEDEAPDIAKKYHRPRRINLIPFGKDWSIWSAPFYPERIWFGWRKKGD